MGMRAADATRIGRGCRGRTVPEVEDQRSEARKSAGRVAGGDAIGDLISAL
jgi:hypothetical protein